eukprot:Gb_20018 [translate_table: standard]
MASAPWRLTCKLATPPDFVLTLVNTENHYYFNLLRGCSDFWCSLSCSPRFNGLPSDVSESPDPWASNEVQQHRQLLPPGLKLSQTHILVSQTLRCSP